MTSRTGHFPQRCSSFRSRGSQTNAGKDLRWLNPNLLKQVESLPLREQREREREDTYPFLARLSTRTCVSKREKRDFKIHLKRLWRLRALAGVFFNFFFFTCGCNRRGGFPCSPWRTTERVSRAEGERRRRDYSEESGGSTLGALIHTMKEALLHLHLLTAHTRQTEKHHHLVAKWWNTTLKIGVEWSSNFF